MNDKLNVSLSQCVEENELTEENLKKKRQSRRMRTRDRERRYSRITNKKEINLLKNEDFSLKWNIHTGQ